MVVISEVPILKKVWEIQKLKISRKGWKNMLVAYIILYLFFFQLSSFLRNSWPEKIQNPKLLQALLSPILLFTMSLINSLIFLPGYLGFEGYKQYQIQSNVKWPWKREDWPKLKKKLIINYVLIYIVINPLFNIFLTVLAKEDSLKFKIQQFPQPWEIIKTFTLFFLLDDFLYMIIHRLFHQIPLLYRYHKIHHQYQTVFTFANLYCHPIQHIFANIIPPVLIFSIHRAHLATLIMWSLWKMLTSIEGHSGYQFPWFPIGAVPFTYGSAYHDFHHTKNVGNYATRMYLFELILGTNDCFFNHEFDKVQNNKNGTEKINQN